MGNGSGGAPSNSAKYRQRHREAGLCIECREPATGGTLRCSAHRASHNAKNNRRRTERERERAAETFEARR